MRVFDIQEFLEARFAEYPENNPIVSMFRRVMELHQPILVTWHPSWFCTTCEGEDEPQHHMGSSMVIADIDGNIVESHHSDGPLMKAGADWPCPTLLTLAEYFKHHPDYGHWIPGIRERPSELFQDYILQGGPAADGRMHIMPGRASYLNDQYGPSESVIALAIEKTPANDGIPVLRVHAADKAAAGVYRYHLATDTVEWDGSSEYLQSPITGYSTGHLLG